MELIIPRVRDFAVDGRGSASCWQNLPWQPLVQVETAPVAYKTQAKVVYSEKGIYILIFCEDRMLACRTHQDHDDIWTEDVVEIFLWTHEDHPFYFEYELSPLATELTLLIPNDKGKFIGWTPWHYDGERKVIKAVSVAGGPQAPGARVESWTAEIFVPFALLKGFGQVPPQPATRWRANLYRMDYDQGQAKWAWCPDTGGNFHNYQHFGTFVFA